ncbi:MAG: hypothetical protein DBW72_04335 [Flavobacteriales bacterium]|nr:MAG: hypothetical protein DBW72_04335 [Flavobacteriales bacterium]
MSKKYKITLEVEEGQETTIKPLGETMTSRVAAGDSDSGTTTTTITNGPRGTDSGADSDTDM